MKIENYGVSQVFPQKTAPCGELQGKGEPAAQDTVQLGRSSSSRKMARITVPSRSAAPMESLADGSAFTALSASASMTGAALGSTIATLSHDELVAKLQNIETKGFSFFSKKSSWLPFSDKHKALTAQGAAEVLEHGSAKEKGAIEVKRESLTYLPMESANDVRELDGLYGSLDMAKVERPDLLKLFGDVEGVGYSFKAKGEKGKETVGAYGAYNLVTGDWKDIPLAREVIIDSGGVTLATIDSAKAADPMKIREELKDAKDAVARLAALGSHITQAEIKMVGKPVSGTTFAERASFFQELASRDKDLDDVKNTYQLVAGASASKNDFNGSSATMLRLYDEVGSHGTRDVQWAYNYIQQNLKESSPACESFHRLLKATGDLNSAINGLQFIQNPVGKEDLAAREHTFVALVEKERDNDEALRDYQALESHLGQGETLEGASKEFFSLMEGLEKRGKPLNRTRRGFVYLRTDLNGQKDRQESFGRIFREMGDIEESIRAMKFLKNPQGSQNYGVREGAFLAILAGEKDTGRACDDYSFVAKHLPEGLDLAGASSLFAGLLGDVKDSWDESDKARAAYQYLAEHHGTDPIAQERFRNILRHVKEVDAAGQVSSALNESLGSEAYEAREKSFFSILEVSRGYRDALENYRGVAALIAPGEDVDAAAGQFVILAKSLTYSYNESPLAAYRETRESFKDNPAGFAVFLDLAKSLERYDTTKEAYDLITAPVREESLEDRKEVFLRIAENCAPQAPMHASQAEVNEKKGKEAVENYRIISTKLNNAENLKDGAARFEKLASVMGGEKRGEEARDAFAFIAAEMERGSFPGKSAQEVTEELMKILLITDSLAQAKTQLLHPQSGNKIEEGDDFVIIGGVMLPVKKGT
ncbi:MAG: hypothetical protein RDV48_02550 [Candidatus Eremiobacteraeota bacterium]|nr:hypothetical protein [Candidatus Eremiobacteraeota bacterium]